MRKYRRLLENHSQLWARGKNSIPNGDNWEIIWLDVVEDASEDDGWYIKEYTQSGKFFCINPSVSIDDIERMLKQEIFTTFPETRLYITEGKDIYFVADAKTGEPFIILEKVR